MQIADHLGVFGQVAVVRGVAHLPVYFTRRGVPVPRIKLPAEVFEFVGEFYESSKRLHRFGRRLAPFVFTDDQQIAEQSGRAPRISRQRNANVINAAISSGGAAPLLPFLPQV